MPTSNQTSDALIIGGGIIGLTCALRLRQAGLSVTLLDKGAPGREASWAGAGVLSPPNPHRSDSLYQITIASLNSYPALCEELRELSGVDPEYTVCGELKLITTEQSLQMAQSNVRVTKSQTMPDGKPIIEILAPDEVNAIEPAVKPQGYGFELYRQAAHIRNPRLLQALQTACNKLGVNTIADAKVTSFQTNPQNQTEVIGAVCENGNTHTAPHTILAAGAWSNLLTLPTPPGAKPLADLLPINPVRGQIVLLKCDAPPFKPVICKGKIYLVPRRDGHVLIGATEEHESGFDKRNTPHGVHWLATEAMQLVPSLESASVVATWAGLRPASPDLRPYIGPAPGYQNLLAATAHFRSGLTQAPETARIITSLITTGASLHDLTLTAPGRPLKPAKIKSTPG
jgi:glycine oxidase